MNPFRIQNILFFIVFTILFALTARIIYPFFSIILWAALIYTLTVPLYTMITKSFSGNKWYHYLGRNVTAAVFSICAVIIIITPLTFIAILAFNQFKGIMDWLKNTLAVNPHLFTTRPAADIVKTIFDLTGGAIDLSVIDIRQQLTLFASRSSSNILAVSTTIIKNLSTFFVSLAFMVFTLYFFFMDGKHLLSVFINAIPIDSKSMAHFVKRFKETALSLLKGYFLVAVYQGFAAWVIFTIFGVKGTVLLAILVSFCSFIPIFGAGTIWLPTAILRMSQGDMVGGILILVLSAFFISTVDNFLRPFLIRGEKMDIHPLLIFFSILGGLSVFGINGLVIGPIILMLFFTGLDIFREMYDIKVPLPDPGKCE